jgi:hypothetical protein
MRINPKRPFNLCYDDRFVVLIDAFCNYFADLFAVGAEDAKTNGSTGVVGRYGCSLLLRSRRHHYKRYSKCRRDRGRHQQREEASHGMACQYHRHIKQTLQRHRGRFRPLSSLTKARTEIGTNAEPSIRGATGSVTLLMATGVLHSRGSGVMPIPLNRPREMLGFEDVKGWPLVGERLHQL